jgi:hypothetical protein
MEHMPEHYIVTTRNPRIGQSAQVEHMRGPFILSRTQVATLYEAREAVRKAITPAESNDPLRAGFDAARAAVKLVGESGGTIGPLPDGTVIEVWPA